MTITDVPTMVEKQRIFRRPPVTEPEVEHLYHPADLYLPNPFPRCRGIYVGGCVQNDRRDGESAHAHCYEGDANLGIICVWHPRTLWAGFDGAIWAPDYLMFHEYPHILEPNDGHLYDHAPTSPWGRLMTRWGLTASRVS